MNPSGVLEALDSQGEEQQQQTADIDQQTDQSEDEDPCHMVETSLITKETPPPLRGARLPLLSTESGVFTLSRPVSMSRRSSPADQLPTVTVAEIHRRHVNYPDSPTSLNEHKSCLSGGGGGGSETGLHEPGSPVGGDEELSGNGGLKARRAYSTRRPHLSSTSPSNRHSNDSMASNTSSGFQSDCVFEDAHHMCTTTTTTTSPGFERKGGGKGGVDAHLSITELEITSSV